MRLGLVAVLLVTACKDEPPPCITLDTSCQVQIDPASFHTVYESVIKVGCGPDKSSCHSDAGRRGGLSLADEQTAFDSLLDGRVNAGDAACSEMVVRTSSPGADYQMPPGTALSAPQRCALAKWVEMGAMR